MCPAPPTLLNTRVVAASTPAQRPLAPLCPPNYCTRQRVQRTRRPTAAKAPRCRGLLTQEARAPPAQGAPRSATERGPPRSGREGLAHPYIHPASTAPLSTPAAAGRAPRNLRLSVAGPAPRPRRRCDGPGHCRGLRESFLGRIVGHFPPAVANRLLL